MVDVSAGPGIWQRAILDRTSSGECFWLAELMPDAWTRSDQEGASRAARVLFQRGWIAKAECVAIIAGGRRSWAIAVGPPDPDFAKHGFRILRTVRWGNHASVVSGAREADTTLGREGLV